MFLHFRKILALAFLALCAILLATPRAHAGLIGQSASVHYAYPDVGTPYAGADYSPAEFIIDDEDPETFVALEEVTFFVVDFFDSALRIDLYTLLWNPTFNNTSFNGLVFNLFSAPAWPVSVASVLSNLPSAPAVTFFDNQLRVDFSGISYQDGSFVQIDFTSQAAAVSEPPVWSLMLLALILGSIVHRRAMQQSDMRPRD